MCEGRQVVPRATLFGKVFAYECTACGKIFAASLLYEAFPSGFPPPANVRNAFFHHVCKEEDAVKIRIKICYAMLEFLMAVQDEDFPISYLLYIIAVLVVMGFLIVGGIFLWLR
jgi:hypothetical protein